VTPHRLGLAGFLVLAAFLRYSGLGWGLRHQPYVDERFFVENVKVMVAQGDFDHRFYEYPGLFFYLLYPAFLFVPPNADPAAAYLVARAVVAAFGVLSVALTYALGARLAGERVGLVAAGFVALSPVEVRTAHMVRPDVVLEAFALLALLVFLRLGPARKWDFLSGIALGAATAVKFTGVFLFPSYLAYRCLAPGRSFRRVLLTSLVALVIFLALTPYAVIHYQGFLAGVKTQFYHHYAADPAAATSYLSMLWTYLGHPQGPLRKALGLPGVALLLLGLIELRRYPSVGLPLLMFPLCTLAVLATADIHFERHLVPTMGVLAFFAAKGWERISQLQPRVSGGLQVAALAVPLFFSVSYVRDISRPGTRDRALDWIEAHLSDGQKVLSAVEGLGLNARRLEVVSRVGSPELDRLLASHLDFTVADPDLDAALVTGLERVYLATPESPFAGPPIGIFVVASAARPRYESIPLRPEWVRVSENPQAVEKLIDGRTDTCWETLGPQRPGNWVQVDFPQVYTLGRVELLLGDRPLRFASRLELLITRDGSHWNRVRYLRGRPATRRQVFAKEGPSQSLILEPVPATGVRIGQLGYREKPWSIAELRLDMRLDGGARMGQHDKLPGREKAGAPHSDDRRKSTATGTSEPRAPEIFPPGIEQSK